MKRAILALAGTVTGLVGVLSLHPHATTALASSHPGLNLARGAGATTTDSAGAAGSTSGSASADQSSEGQASKGKSSGAPSSAAPSSQAAAPETVRTLTGQPVETGYGPVQVQVTVSGKKLTAVQVLEAPTQSGRDVEISNFALPILHDEALSAQSANIQVVSGATYTSSGYQQSLQSALDQM